MVTHRDGFGQPLTERGRMNGPEVPCANAIAFAKHAPGPEGEGMAHSGITNGLPSRSDLPGSLKTRAMAP